MENDGHGLPAKRKEERGNDGHDIPTNNKKKPHLLVGGARRQPSVGEE